MRKGDIETITGSLASLLTMAGTGIHYGCYIMMIGVMATIGVGVLSVFGTGVMSTSRLPPKAVDAPPSFRIASADVARQPVSGHVVSGSRLGRVEVRQYGQLNNRNADLAVVLVMPPPGIGMGTQFVQDLTEINLLRLKHAVLTQTHYDLDTRFGEYRATEMRVDTDGRWKQCLGYRSRFDTGSVYVTGWYCDGSGSRPSPATLACMLDKLVIEAELTSREADRFIRERMTKPARCQADAVTQTTDTRHRGVSPPSRWSQPSAMRRSY